MLQQVLKKYWGYDDFLPLQRESMQCVLDDRDSLVVMPTGGGKSLCYQVPALCRDGLAVVVSPLIALMKDQVDGLRACGVPAAAVNSALPADERRQVARRIERGQLRLLYVSPERLLAQKTIAFLQTAGVSFFAIDEAHCISAWGHDFRPEYRDLKVLRQWFPEAALHSYTATATDRVRQDITDQLQLRDPRVLVGDFRRPNLQYHVLRRERGLNQICSVLDRYRDQSGIVYCITRAEVEKTCGSLCEMGYSALPYHAGMPDEERTRSQDAFLTERADVIVATIAFGMGIDKSNVRFVIHAGMPKSLENYQQESGRAGRDGVDAECWLLYSARDLMTWKHVLQDLQGDAKAAAETSLEGIYAYCTSVTCRHASLIEHFGQAWTHGGCGACDVCLGKLQVVDDALIIGQKILSCVLRVRQRFGADYVTLVLAGSRDQRVVANGHDRLSTWGLLSDHHRQDVRQWIEQLVGQNYLTKNEYHVLQVTDEGRRLLLGAATPTLLVPVKKSRKQTPVSVLDSWEGVDRGLFEALRALRRSQAEARGVPAYIVFGDATLRDMARRRPTNLTQFLEIHGVGQQKSADYGDTFVAAIIAFCQEHNLPLDIKPEVVEPAKLADAPSSSALQSFSLFELGLSVEEVAAQMERAVATTYSYLEAYICRRGISDASRWLSAYELEQIQLVVQYAGAERLKPIHEALHGRISYENIRIAVACMRNRDGCHETSTV